ncbi:tRNA lysidine(34) synthetase TilS [Dysgonomonas sp. ZJ279]|uniref:tRNA lysidine(34) synthetase TilS n=1 Tax=Dysgonomonas sp. ZJ279 TaxID=2709796 RepID=UPI0013EB595F|nr:tRNA lysidine(34) synthetase TilS [Dysgonomonas sp. ZJ279]
MILSKVKQYILNHQLLDSGDKIIVGVSGGADSVAILDMLHQLGYECIVAHCNFHLRNEESNRDALFVKDLCKTYNLKFDSIDFDTNKYAADKAISIEMAARELRYNWFEELRIKHKAVSIAVAHHQDDSVETILLNLIRGTGIRGLTGISAQNGSIIRPLLCLTRNDITSYLSQRNISYVTDSTNNEDIYTRNKIRLNVIPLLETINPSVKDSISQTAEYLLQVQNIYLDYIDKAKSEILNGNKIDIEKLIKYNEPKAILFEILSVYKFNSETIDGIFNALNGISGKIFYSNTHRVLKDRGQLVISEKEETNTSNNNFEINEATTTLFSPVNFKIETIFNSPNLNIEKDKNILYIDKNKLHFPLTIRRWQQGDWFIPFGMKGKKKVSDYFTDQKLSLFEKENIWLLCSKDAIVWIIGHRSDDRYRITTTTSEIIKITLI